MIYQTKKCSLSHTTQPFFIFRTTSVTASVPYHVAASKQHATVQYRSDRTHKATDTMFPAGPAQSNVCFAECYRFVTIFKCPAYRMCTIGTKNRQYMVLKDSRPSDNVQTDMQNNR